MRVALGLICALLLPAGAARAAPLPCANPDALGTSRVLVVDPNEHGRLGSMQYRESLPLADKEVVITFDDGPLPPYSNRILDILNQECVKVTYFLVGRMAHAYPSLVRRMYAEGHTIGTHSQNHPLTMHKMPLPKVEQEVQQGIAATAAALGDPRQVAPFFRIPGLARANAVEKYLADQGLMVWSADFPADDWTRISGDEVARRALQRLEAKGKGILLLHDIQPATALALPGLLHELKVRGYRVVHVVAATPDQPKTASLPEDWLVRRQKQSPFGEPVMMTFAAEPELPAPLPESFGLDRELVGDGSVRLTLLAPSRKLRLARGQVPLPRGAVWPRLAPPPLQAVPAALPVPDLDGLGVIGMPQLPIRQAKVRTAPPPAHAAASTPAATPKQPKPVLRTAQSAAESRPGQWPVPATAAQIAH